MAQSEICSLLFVLTVFMLFVLCDYACMAGCVYVCLFKLGILNSTYFLIYIFMYVCLN